MDLNCHICGITLKDYPETTLTPAILGLVCNSISETNLVGGSRIAGVANAVILGFRPLS